MKAERLAEAERLRARGREAAQRIRARADREVVEIVSEARKKSEIREARAKPSATESSPKPSSVIRSFFEFYRSMIAYSNALIGTGTTMVLSPELGVLPLLPQPERVGRAAADGAAPAAPDAGSATGAVPAPAPTDTTGANP